MGCWKELPREIASRIVEEISRTNRHGNWKSANRQFHDLQQSLVYKEIHVDLSKSPSGKNLRCIIQSPFKPGSWVKTVNLTGFDVPDNLHNFDTSTDPLCQLIKHCPNVKNVSFSLSRTLNAEDWIYFTAAILDSGNWNLKTLPRYDDFFHSSYYYNCAYYMRNTLTSLQLAQGMIGKRDRSVLLEFKELKKLTVDEGVLKDVYDCDSVLKYFPQLENFSVHGFRLGNSVNENVSNKTANGPWCNGLKRLQIVSYIPQRDQELLYIMENFENLEEIEMLGNAVEYWPSAAIQKPIMASFMEYLLKMKFSNFHISGVFDIDWLMDIYYTTHKKLNGDKYSTYLRIELPPLNLTEYRLHTDFQLGITTSSRTSTTRLSLNYDINNEYESGIQTLRNRISQIKDNIQKFSIDWDNHGYDAIGEYIDTLLCTARKILKRIKMINGRMIVYNNTQEGTSNRGQFVKKLKFKRSDLDIEALDSLSNDFPKLEKLVFYNCSFYKGNDQLGGNIYINMTKTAIEKIKIYGFENLGSIILISVYLSDQKKRKCFIDAASDEPLEQIRVMKYNALKNAFKPEQVLLINIQVKSLKSLLYTGLKADGPRRFEITFS